MVQRKSTQLFMKLHKHCTFFPLHIEAILNMTSFGYRWKSYIFGSPSLFILDMWEAEVRSNET